MESNRPRWVDKPEFDWTPETPLRFEPVASIQSGEPTVEPVIIDTRFSDPRMAASEIQPAEESLPQPGKRVRSQQAFAPRLMVGLVQGLALTAIFFCRDHDLWPDDSLRASLIMALSFAPLLLMQGLGRIPTRTLLIWSLFAALCLAGLGAYHHWCVAGVDAGHSGLWLTALVTFFLFIGQSLLLAEARSGSRPARYPALFESSWALGLEVIFCGFIALIVWALWSASEEHLRLHAPSLPLTYLSLPLVTLSLAVAAQLCGRNVLHATARGLVLVLSAALPPLLLLVSASVLFWGFSREQPPFAFCMAEDVLLIIAINASYRGGGEWRSRWRRRSEFAGAFLLLPLAVLAAAALEIRIARFGFTAPRIVALASVLLLFAYAVAYASAALLSLSGGRWMSRIETANLLLAFVALSMIATLASPLGDPVRLAVASQGWRLAHGRIAPEAFDYAYLRNGGLRFGHDVLMHMLDEKDAPAIAHGAQTLLEAEPYQTPLPQGSL